MGCCKKGAVKAEKRPSKKEKEEDEEDGEEGKKEMTMNKWVRAIFLVYKAFT